MIKNFDDAGCSCFDCVPDRGRVTSLTPFETPPTVWPTRTPWAVICHRHGRVYLSSHEYRRQLCHADARWICPHDHLVADWDDDNYEEYLSEQGA